MTFEAAQGVADAVLYEGYLLYPYRATSGKNRVRFQFGVVAPRAFSERDGSESWEMQTECLLEAAPGARLEVRVRFLQLQSRDLETVDEGAPGGFRPIDRLVAGDEELIAWEEAVEQAIDVAGVPIDRLAGVEEVVPFAIPGAREVEPVGDMAGGTVGRVVRTRWPLEGRIVLRADADGEFVRLRVRVENVTAARDQAGRDEALRHAFLGCHTLLGVEGGAFLSLTDPPVRAADAAAACRNIHTWPVLVGDGGRLVLSSPIILPDHPEVAPESPGALFDSTEIDEILTLRILTLTDDEKRAARATDPRARAIIDRADTMPPEVFDRLHGAVRYLRSAPVGLPEPPGAPDWPTLATPTDDDGAAAAEAAVAALTADLPPSVWEPEARVAPEVATVAVQGVEIGKGSSVRLLPVRRADSMDFFLVGRMATVEAVFESVDDETYVAVTIDDDPATDLHRAHGRYFYFAPDELEPVGAAP